MIWHLTRLVCLSLLLAACAQQPANIAPPALGWEDYSVQLQRLDQWQLLGKAGIKTADNSGSLRMTWQQQGDFFNLQFFNPLGQRVALISGIPQQAQILTDESEGPQNLQDSLQQLGWHVPMDQMLFWIKGIPAPGFYELSFNDQQRAASIEQANWQIDYLEYQQVKEDLVLPRKLRLQNNQAQLTLVINEWELD